MLPQVREVKCKRCGRREIQRMGEHGRFEKIKTCPKCSAENSYGTLRIMTYMPKN